MHRRYITFISLLVVAMFSIMPLSQLSSPSIAIDSNSPNKINPSLSNGLLGEVVNSWHVSGKTCAPSSASIESAITLKIDVTSFSESSGAGDTALYFIVSGVNVHTVYIGGTGVYTYTWDVNSMPGNINFHAEYLSGSEFYSMHSMAPEPSVFFHNSYSTFGNSNIHVEKYMNEMGYDGNNTIYLSSPDSGSYSVYGYTNLGIAKNSINDCGSTSNYQNDSVILKSIYDITNNSGNLSITIPLISSGISNDIIFPTSNPNNPDTFYTAFYQRIGLTMINAPPGANTNIQKSYNQGLNVTGPSCKGITPKQAYRNIGIQLISQLPWAGYVTGQYSIYKDLYALSGIGEHIPDAIGSGSVFEAYTINGGNPCTDGHGKNVFGGIELVKIDIPLNELKHSFRINMFSTNYYECVGPTGIIKSANASETINAVTSSAIYGTVGLKPGCSDGNHNYDTSLNSNVYIKSVNSGNFYKVPIKNGNYLFFAKPNTKYELFYRSGSNFEKFKDNSNSIISYIDSKNPGQSTSINLYE
ncbi:MAG: hypothetical protein AMDU4_FER2C00016G0058 [Ferroplasma sp. Type II]|uniref:Uncharacterized protein n=1 Tax=Ferroplasma acidarmanus Fer1 TaxID=333146 RepID=S0ASX2_FERAC|nr:hypothetical protein [Ferroplasma acidarmanus]AGO61175.1 hypothetical protein FACI_IFERC00001G1195 [Ferroplasma acidarmanus Fer1]EQB74345.1 MAG: hypothetical protein AMDU4_FER2C00016G0058 [Ferroplasma sp. Type II]